MAGKGRPKKAYGEKLETELLEIMLANNYALFGRDPRRPPPSNVGKVLVELKQKGISISRRALNKRLSNYCASGIFEKRSEGKEVFYYCRKTGASFLWEKTVKPFIDKMRMGGKGPSAWGYTFIWGTPTHFCVLGHKALILEDGLDITSKLEWEDYPKDIIGEILGRLERVIIKEIAKRVRPDHERTYIQQEAIHVMRKYFENKKLAFVYVLDGSKFKALNREKMAGQWKYRKTEEE